MVEDLRGHHPGHLRVGHAGTAPPVARVPGAPAAVPQHLREDPRRPLRREVVAVVALALVAVAVPAALLRDDAPPVPAAAFAEPTALPPPAEVASEPAARSAQQLRSSLTTALTEHLVLADRLVRARLREDRDLAAAADNALNRSGRGLQAALSMLGDAEPELARGVDAAWTDGLTGLFAYAGARSEGDAGAAGLARERVTTAFARLADLLSGASGGGLAPEAAREDLARYADGLLRQVDAYARADFVEAYEEERRMYAYAFHLGGLLAEGLSGAAGVAPERPTEQDRARLHLQRLLAEHGALASDVVAAGVRARPDRPAATAALRANGDELSMALAPALTGAPGERFADEWPARIDAIARYGDEAREDSSGAQQALAGLSATSLGVAELLAAATGGRSPAETLLPDLQRQDELLAQQVADLRGTDASAAQRAYAAALDHGNALGARLAEALGAASRSESAAGGDAASTPSGGG